MSETFTCVGSGVTRDAALARADEQAAQWFGVTTKLKRTVLHAYPMVFDHSGHVDLFEVSVNYRILGPDTP